MYKTSYSTRVSRQFTNAVPHYDRYANVQHNGTVALLSMINTSLAPKQLLELGCGTGIACKRLLSQFPNTQVDAIDLSPSMIQYCESYLQSPRLQFYTGDFMAIPMQGPYDMIFSSNTLQWIAPLQPTIKKCHALLSENGIFYASTFGPNTFIELQDTLPELSDITLSAQTFTSQQDLENTFNALFKTVTVHKKQYMIPYTSIQDVLRHIKGTGTRGTAAPIIWTEQKLKTLETLIRQRFHHLFMTYELFFIEAKK